MSKSRAKGRKRPRRWIQEATERMRRKGTLGAFGRATPAKIARAKARGGIWRKRAIFAENMRRIAARRKKARSKARRYGR
jgi:hypothetical protein